MKRPEESIQRAIVQWCRLQVREDVIWFHTPNGGARSKAEAGIFKALGVKAGIPDLTFMAPGGEGFFLEIKAPGGSLSATQREFRDHCRLFGIPHAVIKSLDEAMAQIRAWGLVKALRINPIRSMSNDH